MMALLIDYPSDNPTLSDLKCANLFFVVKDMTDIAFCLCDCQSIHPIFYRPLNTSHAHLL